MKLLKEISSNDEIIEKMKRMTEESIDKNKELGFIICKKHNGDLIYRNLAEGINIGSHQKMVTIKVKCNKGEKRIGSFHTHVGSEPVLSLPDLSMSYYYGTIDCIGGISGGIRVFRYLYSPKELIDIITNQIPKGIIKFNNGGFIKDGYKAVKCYIRKEEFNEEIFNDISTTASCHQEDFNHIYQSCNRLFHSITLSIANKTSKNTIIEKMAKEYIENNNEFIKEWRFEKFYVEKIVKKCFYTYQF